MDDYYYAWLDFEAGRRPRPVHGFREDGTCLLCSAGPFVGSRKVIKHVQRQHETGRRHTSRYASYSDGMEMHAEAARREKLRKEGSHLLLLALVRKELNAEFGCLESGRVICDNQSRDLLFFVLQYFDLIIGECF